MIIGLQTTKGLREAIRFQDLVLQDQFQTLEGVGKIPSSRRIWKSIPRPQRNRNPVTATGLRHSEMVPGS